MTSSIFVERTTLGPWAPSTQATASTTFDLPEPFGPTTTVMPGSSSIVVGSANDLKPLRVSVFRNTLGSRYPWRGGTPGIGRARSGRHHRAALRAGSLRTVSGPGTDLEPHDPVPAARARLARPVVDGVAFLIGPQVAREVAITQVPQRRALATPRPRGARPGRPWRGRRPRPAFNEPPARSGRSRARKQISSA